MPPNDDDEQFLNRPIRGFQQFGATLDDGIRFVDQGVQQGDLLVVEGQPLGVIMGGGDVEIRPGVAVNENGDRFNIPHSTVSGGNPCTEFGDHVELYQGPTIDMDDLFQRRYGHERRARAEPSLATPVEVPQFEMVSNPTIRLGDVRNRRFDLAFGDGGRVEMPERVSQDLSGTVWQLVPRWVPLTQEKAREGLLRLLSRRKATQPRSWLERVWGEDELA